MSAISMERGQRLCNGVPRHHLVIIHNIECILLFPASFLFLTNYIDPFIIYMYILIIASALHVI